MTPEEAIEIIHEKHMDMEFYFAEHDRYPKYYDFDFDQATLMAAQALKEIRRYREIGTMEQLKNQKENLNVAYQIISDYEQYGTVEEFKMAQRYMRLVNAHGTIGQVIDSCAEYEEIGTVEECREAMEKQTPKKPVKDKYHHNCCPNCGWIVSGEGGYGEEFCPHCENCGQAIQWENLKGMEDENT